MSSILSLALSCPKMVWFVPPYSPNRASPVSPVKLHASKLVERIKIQMLIKDMASYKKWWAFSLSFCLGRICHRFGAHYSIWTSGTHVQTNSSYNQERSGSCAHLRNEFIMTTTAQSYCTHLTSLNGERMWQSSLWQELQNHYLPKTFPIPCQRSSRPTLGSYVWYPRTYWTRG